MSRFRDRAHAGRELATKLTAYAGRSDVLVLALPRGGVPVAEEVARRLGAPLDVYLVRKIGVPGHEELALGAIASGGTRVLNDAIVRQLGIPETLIDALARREQTELERRERLYRDDRPFPDVTGRVVILVDDGLATGATMRAAVEALRARRPARLVVAVPVGAPETCAALEAFADEVTCAVTPEPFRAVGLWYDDFDQTTDDEVRMLLDRAAARARAA
ncbi:MAG TPA: phosphoribosyltransferase [Methylomirabilota bacterium]|jgi:predicted phosphoribosyltransferase|nr:phosphoribosyltransferase [Methylomirabilota bacterium]